MFYSQQPRRVAAAVQKILGRIGKTELSGRLLSRWLGKFSGQHSV